jgi:hypothetical protein
MCPLYVPFFRFTATFRGGGRTGGKVSDAFTLPLFSEVVCARKVKRTFKSWPQKEVVGRTTHPSPVGGSLFASPLLAHEVRAIREITPNNASEFTQAQIEGVYLSCR